MQGPSSLKGMIGASSHMYIRAKASTSILTSVLRINHVPFSLPWKESDVNDTVLL